MIWRLAGVLGVHPGPFTLRELLAMAEARISQDWNHTSALMALLANIHRRKGQRPYRPSDFHPETVRAVSAQELQAFFRGLAR